MSSSRSLRLSCLLGLTLGLALLPLGSADAGPVERLEKKILAGRAADVSLMPNDQVILKESIF